MNGGKRPPLVLGRRWSWRKATYVSATIYALVVALVNLANLHWFQSRWHNQQKVVYMDRKDIFRFVIWFVPSIHSSNA